MTITGVPTAGGVRNRIDRLKKDLRTAMDELGIDNGNGNGPTTPKTSPKKRAAKHMDDDNGGQADGDKTPPTPSPKKMKTPRKVKKEESMEPEGLLGNLISE